SSTETLFLQQPGLRHAPLRGEPEATVVRRAADGAVYSRTAATFDTTDALPPLRHLPLRSETTLYEWTTNDPLSPAFLKRTAVSWSYVFDETSGLDRVLVQRMERQEGDADDPLDDRLAVVDLVSNREADIQGAAGPGAWLLEQPWHQSASGADGVVLAESWTSYDGGAPGQPGTRGLETRVELRGGPPGPAGDHAPGDPGNSVVLKAYDPFGNLASEVDPLGRERRVERGLLDTTFTFPDREVDPLGRATERHFDARSGLLLRIVDPNGRAAEIEYDSFGRRTAEWGPLDSAARPTVSYLHDYTRVPARVARYAREQSGQGEPAGTDGCVESSAYFDGLGRLVEVTTESASGRIVSRAVSFDAAGRIAREVEPFAWTAGIEMAPPTAAPYARTLAYDAAGRLAATTNARGETERQEYLAWTVVSTDPMGHRRTVERDAFGQVLRVQEFEGTGDGALPVPPATYAHDAAGRLVSLTDPRGTTIHLQYDAQGRRTGLDDPHAGSWRYAYDAKGNLIEETDPMGRTTTLRYDALDRLILKTLADGEAFTWRYDEGGAAMDALGRLTTVVDRTGMVRFTHDAMGRVVFSWRSTFGALHGARSTYDAMGRLTSRTLPGGNRADYAYDGGGELAAVLPFVTRIAHNERGQTTETVYAGGARAQRDYDPPTGRPVALRVTGPAGEQLFEQTSTFDADGLLAARTDLTDPDRPVSQSYAYDGRHRLVEASGPGGTLGYAYDDAGTLTLKEGVTFERDDALHPQWITRTSQGESLTYDAAGNCLAAVSPHGQHSMTYDLRGRMIRVTDPQQGLVVSTDYDAEGRPVREVTDRPGARSVVIWPMREVEVRDGRRTLHHYAGAARIATIDPDGGVFFPILDHLGSARIVLDNQGRVAYRASYSPYGDPVQGGMEDPVTGFRFAEARRDGSGLLQMGWRHYDPALGRFLEPDPILASPFDPQSLNRYAYARDNPVNLTDRDGRSPLAAILFWGALFLLDRNTREDVGASVALTAASILLTGALGPGPAAGFAALKASVPALYAAAASTVLLDSALGEGIAGSYALLLQDLGLSERGAQTTARLATSWFLNSSLQRGFARLQAPLGSVGPGESLGNRSSVDAALAERGIDPGSLGNPTSDAYGTTLAARAGADGRPPELEEFRTLVDSSGRVIGVYGVRDLGPLFDHGAVGLLGTGAPPAVTQPHFAYAIGGVSTQQVARDLFAAGYSGSLFTLTGRGSDLLIEFVFGPYGGGLAYGLGAARSEPASGGGP
ncbi:MAG TPA: RHS repeat-associated core domain-containing protein, partial [Candidatus Cryosericum sp.]|nr:RHS repeat-associated core domain-containing protein [Candidatus Cryosericum sp.]